jgi:hypothetical protein
MKKIVLTIVVALFAAVVLAQTTLTPDKLPSCITYWITKYYKGYTIDKIRTTPYGSPNPTQYYVTFSKVTSNTVKNVLEYQFDKKCSNTPKRISEKNEKVVIQPKESEKSASSAAGAFEQPKGSGESPKDSIK